MITQPDLYQHYKGALYVAIGHASDSTNGGGHADGVVVYYSLEYGELHVRSAVEFHEKVDTPLGQIPRFRRVERPADIMPVSGPK